MTSSTVIVDINIENILTIGVVLLIWIVLMFAAGQAYQHIFGGSDSDVS
jgi:hypothetical protein